MKVRFFGSPDCRDCLKVFIFLNKFQIDFEYIDALVEDNGIQDFCDDHNIDKLPHLQFLDNQSDVVVEHIGSISEEEFIAYLREYFPDY